MVKYAGILSNETGKCGICSQIRLNFFLKYEINYIIYYFGYRKCFKDNRISCRNHVIVGLYFNKG